MDLVARVDLSSKLDRQQ